MTRPGPPDGHVRLLEMTAGRLDPVDLAEHTERYGRLPLRGYERPGGAAPLSRAADRAGLRGRGGAGFPLGTKLRAVAGEAKRPAVVVVNGAEGEPASQKDHVLLSVVPHLVLDGAVLAADAVGADRVHVCVHPGGAAPVLTAAAAQRQRGSVDPVPVEVHEVPAGYVASQETSLVNFLNGRRPIPAATPPLPYQRGVAGRPTLVGNVETLAQLALLARYGVEWYASVGTAQSPGTTLLTVSGAVRAPGVVEVAFGTPLQYVLDGAGATDVQAVLIGGYFGTWLPATVARRLPIAPDALAAVGASVGSGVLIVLPNAACGLAETLSIAEWLAGQRAGQCGPCSNGLPALVEVLGQILAGRAGRTGLARLEQLAGLVEGRGACQHPDGVARMVRSALGAFAADVRAHAAGGACQGERRPA